MSKYDKHTEDTLRRLFPEAYEEQDKARAKFTDQFFSKCSECGASIPNKRIWDSMYHLVATYRCEACGHEDYV